MNQHPVRKRGCFQFTLGQLLALMLGVALGFAPLKTWELTARAKPQVVLELKLLEVPAAELSAMGLTLSKNGFISAHPKRGSKELEQANDVKVQAEPVLVTLSGRPASFNVGSEVPPAVTGENGLTVVEYREVGTHVDISPTILRNGRIEMQILTRLSNVDAHPGREEAITAPVIQSVSSSATIEVADGETVVFGGVPRHPEPMSDQFAWVFVATVRSQNHR